MTRSWAQGEASAWAPRPPQPGPVASLTPAHSWPLGVLAVGVTTLCILNRRRRRRSRGRPDGGTLRAAGFVAVLVTVFLTVNTSVRLRRRQKPTA
ncbi:hypothetical protein [Streptomyces sp. KL116D]|uniref:hypothetical protein n=1 Tax=Streptomyces sp. KL116D TaxID=3045152 RepID=UPI00355666AF